jgi:ribonuclease P protein component
MRFRPEQHLRRQSDFRAVRERGRRIACGPFTVWCLRRDPAVPPFSTATVARPRAETRRVGVVASTAAVGHAVLRTRAKRRLRELFRRHQDLVPAGCDLLLVARSSLNRLGPAELERTFAEACRQLSLLEHA